MAYSDKFKSRVVKEIEKGMKQRQAAKYFKLAPKTIRSWMPQVEPLPEAKIKRTSQRKAPQAEPFRIEDNHAARLAVENARLRILIVDCLLSSRHPNS